MSVSSSWLLYVAAFLSPPGNPYDSCREQRSPYSACQLAERMRPFCYAAHQLCNNTVKTFPLTFVREAKRKSLVFLR